MVSTQSASLFLHPCPDLAVVEVQGADTTSFLQSQLTNDVALLGQGRGVLAGYCNPKGRLLASMVLVPGHGPEDLRMLVRSDLLDGLLKRLRMFVMRAKATFTVRDDLIVQGLTVRENAPEDINLPDLPADTWQALAVDNTRIVRAPASDSTLQRFWVVRPADEPMAFETQATPAPASDWDAQDIRAGLPWIQESTRELFIPQSLNMDLIDGVSFSKGCFPGQEVVARAHYRTQVRRRMHAANTGETVDASQWAGLDIISTLKPDNPAGRVVQAATSTESGLTHILFEAIIDRLEPDTIAVATPEGPVKVQLEPLPYSTVPPEK